MPPLPVVCWHLPRFLTAARAAMRRRIGGVGLQTIRDWVLRFNAKGPEGLKDGKAPGQTSLLKDEHRRALAQKVEDGPHPTADGGGALAPGLIADEFMRTHVVAKRRPRTLDSYETLLRLHILPAIGGLRVTDIRRTHVSKMHADLAARPGAANRAVSVVSAVWNWAAIENEGFVLPTNLAKSIRRNPEQGRERYLSTDELARLGDALVEAETIGLPYTVDETRPTAKHAPKPENRRRKLDPSAVAAIRLLILTGARLREILTARWEYVDFERGLMNLPTSKTGRKSVFLSAAALEVLPALPHAEGNPHIFPGEKAAAPRADLKNPWAAVTLAAELPGLRIHDLRHSFASTGAGGGLGLPIIGKLLGHSQPTTTARYAHLDADPMRRAVNQIGNTISAAMSRKPGAEVVPLKNLR
jgi:integrase